MMQMILYCSMEQNMFFFKEIQRFFVNLNFKFVDKYCICIWLKFGVLILLFVIVEYDRLY